MRPRPLLRIQALLLAVLTLALASGAPSHHHERSDQGPILVDAGHHGHGTRLVEQGDRQTSELVVAALHVPPTSELARHEPPGVVPLLATWRPLPRAQPPPSDRPRAPPVSV